MKELLSKCEICPRKCGVNRNNNELGYCRASNKMKIGGYHLHMWEEPIITGEKGSGTIFFSVVSFLILERKKLWDYLRKRKRVQLKLN